MASSIFKRTVEKVLKRALPTSDKAHHLIVKKSNCEIADQRKKLEFFLCLIWIISSFLFSVYSYFTIKKIEFNILYLAYPFIMIVLTLLWNTPNKRFERLVRDVVNNLELSSILNQKVKIEYQTNAEKTTIKYFSVISLEKSDLLIREMASHFQRNSKKLYIIDDYKILPDSFIVYFSHVSDERLKIESIANIQSVRGITGLTKKFEWDRQKQPMALVVGPTGTGKTNLLKTLILSFLTNDRKNNLYTIDGKASFLSVATSHFFSKKQTAATIEQATLIVDELNRVMNERNKIMNDDFQNEKDQTFDEKYHSGSILLVIDELLALVNEMKAHDMTLSAKERLYPQFNAKLMSLIVKGRSASIHVIVAGQMIPTSILPSESRDSMGMRITLGRISQSQATEIFNKNLSNLPESDGNYSGVIWLDGLGWKNPKTFLSPYYDEERLPFKQTLQKLKEQREL